MSLCCADSNTVTDWDKLCLKPSPFRRVEIPNDTGGVRKLGISTVIDRITNVYLEAMEEAENKGGKSEEIGYARMAGLPQRKHSKRLLGYCRKRYIIYHNNK